jgi:hypothetical protein
VYVPVSISLSCYCLSARRPLDAVGIREPKCSSLQPTPSDRGLTLNDPPTRRTRHYYKDAAPPSTLLGVATRRPLA